jgi:hypothetical protein
VRLAECALFREKFSIGINIVLKPRKFKKCEVELGWLKFAKLIKLLNFRVFLERSNHRNLIY